MSFERWFKERTSRFERILLTSALGLLALLLLTQALLTQPGFRQMLSLVDRLEGEPYEPPSLQQPASAPAPANTEPFYLTLDVISGDGDGLQVRVNGETAAVFGQSGSVVVEVRDGDDVEVYGDDAAQMAEIRVTEVSEGMIAPARGKTVTYFGRPETVSWVVVGQSR